MRVISLRISNQIATELDTIAMIEENSISHEIREAISEKIAEKRKDKEFQDRLHKAVERNQETLKLLSE